MLTFVGNFVWVVAMVLGLTLAGGVAARPFAASLPFAPLIQPLAGLLLVAVGTLALYVVLRFPLGLAGLVTWGLCCVATLGGLYRRRWRTWAPADTYAILGVALLAAALATAATTAASIHHDEPAFVYIDWTDHLGYAHLADWLNVHRVSESPALDPALPYSSWPHFIFFNDPRFGSLATLALVSQVIGRSGMFSYDLGSALVLTTTVLAVAAVFAQNRLSLALLVVGLSTCHWFDYNRTGFFAKAVAFPSIFFVVGLFIVASTKRMTPFAIAVLTLFAAAVAIMQSGTSEALFLTVLGGTYLLSQRLFNLVERRSRNSLEPQQLPPSSWRDNGIVLGLLVCTAVISSGILARPLLPSFPDWGYGWEVIFPRIAELETQTLGATVLSPWQLQLALVVSVCLWAVLAGLAIACRDPVATALIFGPAALLVALRLADQRAMTFQMIGVFYPLALCGAARLARPHRPMLTGRLGSSRPKQWLALSALAVAILLHCPRFINTAVRYGVAAPAERQFLASEMHGLAAAIGTEPVLVDLGFDLQLNIVLMVELGRQNIDLHWSPEGWKSILGYRPTWPVPRYSKRASLRLVRRHVEVPFGHDTVYVTRQYKLVRTQYARSNTRG